MTIRQEKVDAIYRKIARKDLSFGCRVLLKSPSDGRVEEEIIISDKYNSSSVRGRNYRIIFKEYIHKIIGHPIMIGDVMNWFGEKRIDICWSDSVCALDVRDGENSLDLFNFWENKRLPLEEQSDECIDFIYNLIIKQGEK